VARRRVFGFTGVCRTEGRTRKIIPDPEKNRLTQ